MDHILNPCFNENRRIHLRIYEFYLSKYSNQSYFCNFYICLFMRGIVMNTFNYTLVFTFIMFMGGIFLTDAIAGCNENGSASIKFGQCGAKISRLETLFTYKNEKKSASEILPKIYKQQMNVPYPTRSPARKKIGTKNPLVFDPMPKSTETNKYAEIISNSTNKSLSKFGPDAPAEFIVRCHDNQLNVLFNFPGYPMNGEKHANALSYQVDRAEAWTAWLQPANEFSAIGIWENSNAYIFLASIIEGDKLHVSTLDMEKTKITADFNIPDITSKFEKLTGNCHLPS